MIDLWSKPQVNVSETFYQYRTGLPGDMGIKNAETLVQDHGLSDEAWIDSGPARPV
jgi:hypothetical protein